MWMTVRTTTGVHTSDMAMGILAGGVRVIIGARGMAIGVRGIPAGRAITTVRAEAQAVSPSSTISSAAIVAAAPRDGILAAKPAD
jgi:hypothetical protein